MSRSVLWLYNQSSGRGTEVAMADYAMAVSKYNKDSLNIHAVKSFNFLEPLCFEEDFSFGYLNYEEVEQAVKKHNIGALHHITSGVDMHACAFLLYLSENYDIKITVQVVFPNGHLTELMNAVSSKFRVFAVSKWLSSWYLACQGVEIPDMEHIVTPEFGLPSNSGCISREKLGIPDDAFVVGRHGGPETFDIPGVRDVVYAAADMYDNLYFVFMNTNDIQASRHNIKVIPRSSDRSDVRDFVDLCDVGLHARVRGETFGMSVAEFDILNKPVITWAGSAERAHYIHLSTRAVLYNSSEELLRALDPTMLAGLKILFKKSQPNYPYLDHKTFYETYYKDWLND